MKKIAICAPVYNESKGIEYFLDEIVVTLSKYNLLDLYKFEIILVNDGSTDNSLDIIKNKKIDIPISVINFSRNFGHPAACAALVDYAEDDAIILMDSDMQDDPEAIPKFIEKWKEGYECVYAIRSSRKENVLYRLLFNSFYKIIDKISTVKLPMNSGNYSLIDKKVIAHIRSCSKQHRYFPGIRAYMGFKQCGISVGRRERYDSVSRVGLAGLFALAANGVFSFSYLPMRIFGVVGLAGLTISICMIIYALWGKFVADTAIPAWTSVIVTTSLLGSIIILGITIVGEYILRIYDEIRSYPSYIVSNIYKDEANDER